MAGRKILDLKELGWECVDWIYLAQDSCGESNEPAAFIEVGEYLE
jgi:hypothetical protein